MNQKFIIAASAAIIAVGFTARQARAAVLPECEPPLMTCAVEDGGDCPTDMGSICASIQPDPNCAVVSVDCDLGGCTHKGQEAAELTCYYAPIN
jgi:hypothetical protein